jgi:hypothetical protein
MPHNMPYGSFPNWLADAEVTVDPGINWCHYTITKGKFTAAFRLHKNEDLEDGFYDAMKSAGIKPDYNVKKHLTNCELVANYYDPQFGSYGYDDKELVRIFSPLNEFFNKYADRLERELALNYKGLGFLRYHGIQIFKCS